MGAGVETARVGPRQACQMVLQVIGWSRRLFWMLALANYKLLQFSRAREGGQDRAATSGDGHQPSPVSTVLTPTCRRTEAAGAALRRDSVAVATRARRV
ncbi:MAG TPA: hypothetical protein VLW52_06530 [Opitutaceae bacterium]|nr:hypothetical protein [Opitutaceae bacterium]